MPAPNAAATERASTAPPMLMDISGVAIRLGVPVRHVRRLVAERQIPYIKWRRLLRFDPNEIEAWLDGSRHPSADTQARPYVNGCP